MTAPDGCSCPTSPARTVTDPDRHHTYHQTVQAQGGPAGLVNAHTLRTHRGLQSFPGDLIPEHRPARNHQHNHTPDEDTP